MISIGLDPITMEFIFRLLISMILGGIVGLERELIRKPAGLRTHAIVCMGACLFTIASFYMAPNSPQADYSRIAAGIVTGIGFIGAGSIIATKGHISGVTTAASLWMVAAIGLMIGMGNYILPFVVTLLSFVVLKIGKVEREIENNFVKKSRKR